jgi:spoIIIJ-associated protein
MAKKVQSLITTLTEDLLGKLTIVGTVTTTESDGAVKVTIDSEERGILIGRHGSSLEAIQILLGQLVYKKLGTWVRIVVTVGDYRERREEQLKEMATSAVERVTSTHEPVVFAYLTPAERRTIHLLLAEHPEVVSESEGEGRERRLVIKLRQ